MLACVRESLIHLSMFTYRLHVIVCNIFTSLSFRPSEFINHFVRCDEMVYEYLLRIIEHNCFFNNINSDDAMNSEMQTVVSRVFINDGCY